MRLFVRLAIVLVFVVAANPMAARDQAPAAPAGRVLAKANYDLAGRWTSAKVGKYVFSTAVTPHWLEFSDRFWYSYETPAGEKWWIVDPVKKTKTPLWDNAKMAAQLTRILRTPYDAQHLPINTIRFIENDTKIRFSVSLPRDSRVENAAGQELTGETQQEQNQLQGGGGRGGRGGGRGNVEQQQQQQGGRGGRGGEGAAAATRLWWLEYDVATGTLVLNEKYEADRPNPTWAQVSPDKQTVVFARGHNLFMMDAKNFELAKKKADDPAIEESQLTTDGERYYGFAGSSQGGQTQDNQQQDGDNTTQEGDGRGAAAQSALDKKFGPRARSVGLSWAQDHRKFSAVRSDTRKVGELWVINSLANPRPPLETYKYRMPGEENQTQVELHVFDIAAKKGLKLSTDGFKDQQMALATAPTTNLQREKQETTSRWLSPTSDKIYFNRTSRDLKRIDIVEADTTTGEPRIAVQERSNTYIELQPLRVLEWRQAAHPLVRAGRLGPLLPAGRERQDDPADHVRRVRLHRHRRRRREGARALFHRRGTRGRRGSVLPAPVSRQHRHERDQAAQSGQRLARRADERQVDVLRRQLLARRHGPRVGALRCARQQGHGSREDRRRGAARGRLPLSGGVQRQSRRWRHRPLRHDVQAVRLRSLEEVSDRAVRLSRAADRISDQDVLAQERERPRWRRSASS